MLNIDKIVLSFINTYYDKLSRNGWMDTLKLFDSENTVNYNCNLIGSEYDLVCKLAENSIKKAFIENIKYDFFIINSDIFINVHGYITFINFNNQYSQKVTFSDAFILSNKNFQYKCIYHSFYHL